jgi:hypothetical protein
VGPSLGLNSGQKSLFSALGYVQGLVIAHDDIAAFTPNILLDAIQIDEIGMVNAIEVLLSQHLVILLKGTTDYISLVVRHHDLRIVVVSLSLCQRWEARIY